MYLNHHHSYHLHFFTLILPPFTFFFFFFHWLTSELPLRHSPPPSVPSSRRRQMLNMRWRNLFLLSFCIPQPFFFFRLTFFAFSLSSPLFSYGCPLLFLTCYVIFICACVNLCAQFDNLLLVYVSPKCSFKLRLLYNQQAKTQRLFIYCNKCQKRAKSSHRRSWRNNFLRPTNPLTAAALTYLFLSFLYVSTDLWAAVRSSVTRGSWLLMSGEW